MRFVCDSCRAQYMISDEKVGAKGVKVRCKKCGYVILVRRQDMGVTIPPDEERTIVHSPPGSSPNQDSVLRGVEDDEIGAVFDQVLNAAGGAAKVSVSADTDSNENGAQNEYDSDNTRVVDLATLRKLAEQSEGNRSSGETSASNEGSVAGSDEEATAAAMQHEWYVAIDEKQVGPLTMEKVKDHWDRGEVGPDSLCWRSGFSDWVPLSEASELASVLAPRHAKPVIAAPMVTGSAAASMEAGYAATGTGGRGARADIPVLAPEPNTDNEPSWRPSAASALASLVQDEMAALNAKPAPGPKTNGATADPAVEAGLLDVPDSSGAPSPNMPPASDRAPAQSNGYGSMQYMPSYTVPPPTAAKGRGVLIAIISGVGVAVVLLLGATVVLLYQGQNRQPVNAVATVQTPPNVPPPSTKPVDATPTAVAQPGTPTGAAATSASNPATTTNPPPTPVADANSNPRTEARSGNSGRDRTKRNQHGKTPEEPAAASHKTEPIAPPPAPEVTGDDFDKAFGTGSGSSSSKPPPTKARSVYVPPPPGGESTGGGAALERLGQSDIMEVVLSHKPAIVKCVDEQKKREPGLSGKMVVRWNV